MAQRWLCFFLLLPLKVLMERPVNLVKTVRSTWDVTPLCSNETEDDIVFVFCKIRDRGESCRLIYSPGRDFESNCSSRFTLKTENETVFLSLTGLTPEDDGIYTCQCARSDGAYLTTLNVSVEETKDPDHPTHYVAFALTGACTFVILTVLILGLIYSSICHRNKTRSEESQLSIPEPPHSLKPDDPGDHYESLQHPGSDLYQTLSSEDRKHDTNAAYQEMDDEDKKERPKVYENL